jgi:molybdopterin synthase catalytic subunit
MITVTSEPIDLRQILSGLATPASGGMDMFVGTVRNNADGREVSGLEYTAYVPMAEKLMGEIETEIRARWPVHRVALVHRVGLLAVGEVAVVTAVSSAHRREAFEACRHAIERIKADVPIWKKEIAAHSAAEKISEGRRGG